MGGGAPGHPLFMPLTPLPAYYDSPRKSYLVQDLDGNWMPVNDKGLLLHLEKAGYTRKKTPQEIMSPAEAELLRIQREHNVLYTGPLAGYEIGLHHQGGYKILVTHSPKFIEPLGTDWSLIKAVIENQFDSGSVLQSDYFHLWLKIAEEAFRSKNFVPGPAVAIAGPGNCGKTLLSLIVTEILGGRSASPYRYMMGRSDFNKDLLGSEVLIIDDEVASKDLRVRRSFGTQIKNMLFAAIQSGHGKRLDAISLKPFWRMLILLNDEPENLLVLPPIDESLEDKIMLLRSYLRPMPMASSTPEEKAAFWAQIQAQIPAYVGWLRYTFKAPDGFKIDTRTGVVPYKHPELLAEISELAPENRLLSLIEAAILSKDPVWCGTSEEISKTLCNSEFGFEARNLLDWPNATGSYMGRLIKKHPKRIFYRKCKDTRIWRICRDPEDLAPDSPFQPQPEPF